MSVKRWRAALLCGALFALPLRAQDAPEPKEPPPTPPPAPADQATAAPVPKTRDLSDPPLHRWGGWTISGAAWAPKLSGADEEVATVLDPEIPHPLMLGTDTTLRGTWKIAYHLPKGIGTIQAMYDSMNDEAHSQNALPGEFIFFETRAFPGFRGAFDDGLADGVTADARRKTREIRFDFSNRAFETAHAHGTWSAGYRTVDHNRAFTAHYLAIAPNLPPPIPPAVPQVPNPSQFLPRPDIVRQKSDFSGSGVGAALDMEFVLNPRFSVVSGLSVSLLRGKVDTQYTSFTSFYFDALTGPGIPLTKDELFAILESGSAQEIAAIGQQDVGVGIRTLSEPRAAQTFDAYVGVQATIIPGLKVFATFRDMYYAGVGEYVVPQTDGSNQRTTLNAGYEGYLLGVSWRY